jgi:RHS repeat-associated protein
MPLTTQEQESNTADPSVLRKFTTYMKDYEGDAGKLNYAVFRQHSARIARFLRPDPVRGKVGNPQRLNRYAYVMNNPMSRIDPNGLDPGQGGDIPIPYEHDGDVFDILDEMIAAGVKGTVNGIPVGPEGTGRGGLCGTLSTPTSAFTGGTGGLGLEPPGMPELGCPMPAPSTPRCFGDLRYRDVREGITRLLGIAHSFWNVRDRSGTQYIVNAGPSSAGHLNVWEPTTDILPSDPSKDSVRASQSRMI